MAASKRGRPEKGFYRIVEQGERIRPVKTQNKKEKFDGEKMYAIKVVASDKKTNKVKIHFVGYEDTFDEWRDAKEVFSGERSSKLGRITPRLQPSEESLEERASCFFYNLGKPIKTSLFSSKKESPEVRIEERIDQDVYDSYLVNIGIVKMTRGRSVHGFRKNDEMCNLLGTKWSERILNINGDFCYVVAGSVRFWLNQKKPVKEFFYVGDHLLEHQISNDLQLIFTFVRGDGVKDDYKTDQWK